MNRSSFKAVEFQRKRRDYLSILMQENPMEFEKQLKDVKKKYAKLFKTKKKN